MSIDGETLTFGFILSMLFGYSIQIFFSLYAHLFLFLCAMADAGRNFFMGLKFIMFPAFPFLYFLMIADDPVPSDYRVILFVTILSLPAVAAVYSLWYFVISKFVPKVRNTRGNK